MGASWGSRPWVNFGRQVLVLFWKASKEQVVKAVRASLA